jgi:hypothetical protein
MEELRRRASSFAKASAVKAVVFDKVYSNSLARRASY